LHPKRQKPSGGRRHDDTNGAALVGNASVRQPDCGQIIAASLRHAALQHFSLASARGTFHLSGHAASQHSAFTGSTRRTGEAASIETPTHSRNTNMADAKFTEMKTLAADGAAATRKLAEDGAARARAVLDQTVAGSTKATETMMKASEDATEFGRGNLEALTRAIEVSMNGLQEFSKHSMAAMQTAAEHAMTTAKAVSGAKSLKEASDLQAAFLRAALDRAMADQAKFQDLAMKTVEASLAPITARLSVAMEKVQKPLAA